VTNADNVNGFATVGIQNGDRSDGLLYTYWNYYSPAATVLNANRAISFRATYAGPTGLAMGHVDNASIGSPLAGASVHFIGSGRIFESDAVGDFVGTLPAGEFDVFAHHESFAPDTTYGVNIVPGETAILDFNLVDICGPTFAGTTLHPDTEDTTGPYVIESSISDFSGLGDVHFFYRTSSDSTVVELPLVLIDPPTGLYRAEIPGQPLSTVVSYWLTGTDVVANEASDPPGAPEVTYRFGVAVGALIFHDDMEVDTGWEVIPDGGGLISGRWERCDPNGIYDGEIMVQPEDDATPPPGVMCWITGNDPPGSNPGGHDVDGIPATLLSPWYDLSLFSGATVWYSRWYTNDTGNNPDEDYWLTQVSADGENWVDMEYTNESERSWLQQSFRIEDYVPLGPTIRFRFYVSDEAGDSIIEAGLDEFMLTGFSVLPDDEPPAVTVVLPNGGESIPGGEEHPYAVEWTASDNIWIASTEIILSTDGGASWPDTLAKGLLVSPHEVIMPPINATNCLLRIICEDLAQNVGSDTSDAQFTITYPTAVEGAAPARLTLAQNRPNPFNPRTEIRFNLPAASPVTLQVFDLEGKLINTLVDGPRPAGPHTVSWHGQDRRGAQVASGVYFYRLRTDAGTLGRKMILLK